MRYTDLGDFLWACVRAQGIKTHYCPRSLVSQLVEDLIQRLDAEDVEINGVEDGSIDQPGMIMVDRSEQKLKIDTFSLVIPSEDFEVFYGKLLNVNKRVFSDGSGYVKIHGWMHCVVFTTEQRDLVLEEMRRMLPDVKKIAVSEREEFNRRLRSIPNVVSRKEDWVKNPQPLSGIPNTIPN